MSNPIKVRFKQWDCELQRSRYGNGRTALVLIHAEDRDPVATVTVNLPDEPLGPNEVFVKDWSENEGMVEAMEQAGILKATGNAAHSGFVSAPRCVITHPDLCHSYEQELARGRSVERDNEMDFER